MTIENHKSENLDKTYYEEGGDSDADAFAIVALLIITAISLAYYFNA